ncbi:MAG: 3-deoxy-7-phosphoheptulonate synthase, partial [Chthoniobacterales bacterium]
MPARTKSKSAPRSLENVRVRSLRRLSTPAEIKRALPAGKKSAQTAATGRAEAQAILHGRDKRFLVIVGPCSVHDPEAA